MGHSYEYEHLGQDIPDTKVVTPRTLRVSGDVEVRPWPPLPYDFEEMVATTGRDANEEARRINGIVRRAYASEMKPSRIRRILDTLKMSW